MRKADEGKAACLVAMDGEKVVGSFCVNFYESDNLRYGLIDSVAVAKEYRGQRIASRLLKKSIEWLENQECEDRIYAIIDRYNSPSYNMFLHHGFALYEVPQQFKDMKWTTVLKLWANEGFFFAIGTYFVKKCNPTEKPEEQKEIEVQEKDKEETLPTLIEKPAESSPVYHYTLGWLALTLPWLIIGLFRGTPLGALPYLALFSFLSLFVHETSHKIFAKSLGIPTYFKSNVPGFVFNHFLALSGVSYPFYGSTYVKQEDWNYLRQTGKNAFIYFVGPLASVGMALGFTQLSGIFSHLDSLSAALALAAMINRFIVIVNLLPFYTSGGFPWDGVKVYRWNRAIWLLWVLSFIYLLYFI